jgi:hypothetical protein
MIRRDIRFPRIHERAVTLFTRIKVSNAYLRAHGHDIGGHILRAHEDGSIQLAPKRCKVFLIPSGHAIGGD